MADSSSSASAPSPGWAGYAEFTEARRLVFGGLFGRVIRDSLEVHRLQYALGEARTPDERWFAILTASHQLGLSGPMLFAAGGKLHTWTFPFGLPSSPPRARLADVLRAMSTPLVLRIKPCLLRAVRGYAIRRCTNLTECDSVVRRLNQWSAGSASMRNGHIAIV